ncbi:rare lipoprotein A [Acidithrix ferrooxidans]|uniref:Rare lipoprotein A n=2 Tax=Acidithrix ferrooxidans TaxID=1280514 RepID=A0A0D8HEP3_9ACTN|nr:rare lipoprotein A [Acidithrix ferrooxidans]
MTVQNYWRSYVVLPLSFSATLISPQLLQNHNSAFNSKSGSQISAIAPKLSDPQGQNLSLGRRNLSIMSAKALTNAVANKSHPSNVPVEALSFGALMPIDVALISTVVSPAIPVTVALPPAPVVVPPAPVVVPPAPVVVSSAPVVVSSAPVVVSSALTHVMSGIGSWYATFFGSCANLSAPFGTIITITDLSTGKSTTCRVDDRGPYVTGRVIDLSPDVFSQLSSLSNGLIPVKISW